MSKPQYSNSPSYRKAHQVGPTTSYKFIMGSLLVLILASIFIFVVL